jgi:nucleotide-binding universal stress UspA family protein
MSTPSIILHPTDFSQPCEEAFQVACSLAKDHAARLSIVHVAVGPAFAPVHMPAAPPLPDDPQPKLEEMLHRFQATAPGLQGDYRIISQGHAATAIVAAAQELQAELIVMGTHGRTGLGRMILGSVAEQVLRTAPCPVVTIRAAMKT